MDTSDAPLAAIAPPCLVFGRRPGHQRPQAALFEAGQTAIAVWAAQHLGLLLVKLHSQFAQRLHETITQWTFPSDGQLRVPFVPQATLEAIERALNEAQPSEGQAAAAVELAPALPPPTNPCAANRKQADRLWDAIGVGSLVLALETEDDGTSAGWWEAVVLAVDESTYTLFWRDYPEQGLVRRTRQEIAVLPLPRSRATPPLTSD